MVPIRCSSQHENKDTNCESSLYFLNKFLSSIYASDLQIVGFSFEHLLGFLFLYVLFSVMTFYLTNYDV